MYSLLSFFTTIGSYSFTVRTITYVLVVPSSAATITSNLLAPSFTVISPVPLTGALSSFAFALIVTFSVPASASALYSKVLLLNSLSSFIFSISKLFRVASLLFVTGVYCFGFSGSVTVRVRVLDSKFKSFPII